MLSEMTAMNSTLLLLNALGLAVLVAFHFQPAPTAPQTAELVTYNKPLTPMPQLAVMTETDQVAPRLTAELPVASANIQDERWFF